MKTNVSQQPASHARIYGSPGARVRLLGLARSLWPLILVFIALGYLVRAALPVPALSTSVTGLLFLALAVAVAAAANYSRDRLQNHIKGARGEESVARTLNRLPANWHVFHGVEARALAAGGGADIDHVVVGPKAIFAIETKNWSGRITAEDNTILCDGEPPDRDPLEQVRNAAASLREQLQAAGTPPPPVIPILCFCGNARPTGLAGLAGVMICNEDQLCAIMQNHQGTPLPDACRAAAIEWLKATVET